MIKVTVSSSRFRKINCIKAIYSRHKCSMLRGESSAEMSKHQHHYNAAWKGNNIQQKGKEDNGVYMLWWGSSVLLSAKWKLKSQEAFKEGT